MAVPRISKYVILGFLILFSLLSCSKDRVYFFSDPQLEELEGNFLKQRIFARLKGIPSRYVVLEKPDELFLYLETILDKDKPVNILLSPFYWSLNNKLEQDASTVKVWMNIKPQKNVPTVYTSWDQLDEMSDLSACIPREKLLVLYSDEALSMERLNGLQKLFSSHNDVQWIVVEKDTINNLENRIDLGQYKGFFLAAGSLNIPLYAELSKWNIPIGGELPFISTDSDLIYLQLWDNWPEVVEQALKSFKEEDPGFPVSVNPLWKGNESVQSP